MCFKRTSNFYYNISDSKEDMGKSDLVEPPCIKTNSVLKLPKQNLKNITVKNVCVGVY